MQSDDRPDPRVAGLPAWLRLQGRAQPDMGLAEAEWCSMLHAAATEIERLRAVLAEVRRNVIESADDVVWMRGGIETVVDRISAALGDQEACNERAG